LSFLIAALLYINCFLSAGLSAAESDAAFFNAQLAGLGADKPFARAQAADQLGRLKDPAAIPYLITALKDPSPLVRRQAADSLGLLKAGEAAPELGAILENDPNAQVRQAAALALGAAAEENAVPFLLGCLRDKDDSVLFPCVNALGNLKAKAAVKPLKRLLAAADADLKAAVISALGQMGSEEAYNAVQSELGKKQSPAEEEASVQALGNFARPGASARIKRALASSNDRLKASACLALARSGDKSEFSACSGLLNSSEAKVRKDAARALGLMGDASAAPALEEALKKETNAEAAQLMGFALERLRNRSAGKN